MVSSKRISYMTGGGSYPIYAAVTGAAICHLALVITEKKRLHYTIYTIGLLPISLSTSVVSLVYATLAPL